MSGGLARDLGDYRAVKHLPVSNQVNIRKEKVEIAQWVGLVPLLFFVLPRDFHYFLLHSPFSTRYQKVSSGGISLAGDVV